MDVVKKPPYKLGPALCVFSLKATDLFEKYSMILNEDSNSTKVMINEEKLWHNVFLIKMYLK